MPFWDTWFKSGGSSCKSGALRQPKKFQIVCGRCGRKATPMSIPAGYEEPFVAIECECGQGEAVGIERG